MLAVVANALYTTLRRYGTTQQLAAAIILCVVCALLLLPAIIWYNLRFSIEQGSLSLAEVEVMLAYIALCGWLVPLSVTSAYCLFTAPRTSTISGRMRSQKKRTTEANTTTVLQPPRYQLGVPVPFVFGEDIAWGWLEYRNGRLQGQRLELRRAIVTIGRGEENDIWLDDEMASRHHAELAWNNDVIYLTDCESLNGVLVNGRRIQGSTLLEPGEMIEIGSHRFIFELAREEAAAMSEQSDPLINHKWRSSLERLTGANELPPTRPLYDNPVQNVSGSALVSPEESVIYEWQETAQVNAVVPSLQPIEPTGAFRIRNGEFAGKIFLLDRPVITIGRGAECEVVLNDISVSRRHTQFLRQASGNYAQDITSRNGTTINNELLLLPRLLVPGDIVCVGNISLEYISFEDARTAPVSTILQTRSLFRSMSGPMPLKLPSKPKVEPDPNLYSRLNH
jgi:pSer/pThr/pTyr-binding forkhead associated (FHA) protein